MKAILFCLSMVAFSVFGQTCLADYEQAVQQAAYIDNGDGTVTHTELRLTWMRCSVGQTWQDETCVGDPSELTWQQALQLAHGFQYAGKAGWRVPNIKELATLTERQCVRPAIDELLFPNTPSDDFWTSTPSVVDPQRAWVVAFFNSSNSIKDKQLFVFTRLVRTAE
jgi:hypothetical protein